MRSLKGVLLSALLGISIFILSGCYLFPKEEAVLAPPLVKPPEITYETSVVKKDTIEKKITGSGTFVSVEQSNMFFEHRGGRLKAIHTKVGTLVEEGDILAELDTDDLELQVEQQKIQLSKAETRLNQVKAHGGDKYERAYAEYDLELAKLALESVERQLEQCMLRANMSGTVVYLDYNASIGDYINAYQPVARIADPKSLQLEVTGSNVGDFKLGMDVDIIIKNNTYPGKVVMTPAEMPLDLPDNQRNIVRLEADNLPKDVKLGDSAQISLILDRREDVIVVPRSLVRNYMGRKYVLVYEDNLKKERDVEVGLETPTDTEIMKGLEEGELIIVR